MYNIYKSSVKEGERTATYPEQDAFQENGEAENDEAEAENENDEVQDEIDQDPPEAEAAAAPPSPLPAAPEEAFNSTIALGDEEDDSSSPEFLPEMAPPDGFDDSGMDDSEIWEEIEEEEDMDDPEIWEEMEERMEEELMQEEEHMEEGEHMEEEHMEEDHPHHHHTQEDTPETIARVLQEHDTEAALDAYIVPDHIPIRQTITPTILSSDQVPVTAVTEKISDNKNNNSNNNNRRSKYYHILLAVFVLAGIAVAVGVGISKRNGSSQQHRQIDDGMSDTLAPAVVVPPPPTMPPSLSPQPSQSPTDTPTSTVFSLVAEDIWLNFGPTTYTRLLDSRSPQARAARWIGETDVWFTFPLPKEDASVQKAFRQRYALAVFYYSTGGGDEEEEGGSWVDQLFFLSNRHECQWNELDRGIILCTNDRQVQAIDISGNNLTGAIPPELGVLEELLQLTLIGNLITGTIPEAFYDLTALQILFLPGNPLSGTLSTNIGRLSNLFILSIEESEITGTLPSELGALTNLRALTLGENSFNGSIPEEWSSLSDISSLSLGNNFLTGPIPPWIAEISSLATFSVYGNMLTGTIPEGDYPALSGFSVGRNDLTQGPFPEFLLGGALDTLLLSYSGLTGRVPEDWSAAPQLLTLNWSRNAITGTLPTSLGLLQDLRALRAGFNMHMGTLPSELGNTGLAQLALEFNEFTGTIPETYLNLPLDLFAIGVNKLTGDLTPYCEAEAVDTMNRWTADCPAEVTCPCCEVCFDEEDNQITFNQSK